ncbi:MAG: hypothetical protein H0T51_19120, partial [Pirellulales bacterium]|nr:hypothetical protein [Pirellulales bacterium]
MDGTSRVESNVVLVGEPASFEMVRGRGVKATVDARRVLVGNAALLREGGVEPPTADDQTRGTTVYVALDGRTVGELEIADRIRPGVAALEAQGHQVAMIGDGVNDA